VLLLIGAEKIGAVGVPEGGVMEDGAGDGVALAVNEARRKASSGMVQKTSGG